MDIPRTLSSGEYFELGLICCDWIMCVDGAGWFAWRSSTTTRPGSMFWHIAWCVKSDWKNQVFRTMGGMQWFWYSATGFEKPNIFGGLDPKKHICIDLEKMAQPPPENERNVSHFLSHLPVPSIFSGYSLVLRNRSHLWKKKTHIPSYLFSGIYMWSFRIWRSWSLGKWIQFELRDSHFLDVETGNGFETKIGKRFWPKRW